MGHLTPQARACSGARCRGLPGVLALGLAVAGVMACESTSRTVVAGSGDSTEGGGAGEGGAEAGAPGGDAGTAGNASGGQPGTSDGGSAGNPGSAGSGGEGGGQAECEPTTKRCDDLTPQVCSEDGRWQALGDGPCPFLCTAGECTGVCSPGARQCADNTPQRCTSEGTWVDDGEPCVGVCDEGACTGNCTPDSTQCVSTGEIQTCGDDGTWSSATECPFVCLNGACGGDCQPEDTRCASSTQVQTCGAEGEWSSPSDCPNACVNGACGGVCKPGQTRCASTTQVQTCGNNGQWGASSSCTNVCTGNACGSKPKVVFVTSSTLIGQLWLDVSGSGPERASAYCQMRADAVFLPGTYKAWLSDDESWPAADFTTDGGPYQLPNGTIVANNWADLVSGSLRHPIDMTELKETPPSPDQGCENGVWTNTTAAGLRAVTNDETTEWCGDWFYGYSVLRAQVGSWSRSDGGWSNQCTATCDVGYPLYCVQQ